VSSFLFFFLSNFVPLAKRMSTESFVVEESFQDEIVSHAKYVDDAVVGLSALGSRSRSNCTTVAWGMPICAASSKNAVVCAAVRTMAASG